MKNKFVASILLLQLLCLEVKSQIKKATNAADTEKMILSSEGQSKIQIFKEGSGENTGWHYKSTETNYEVIYRCGNPFGEIFNDVPLENNCGYYLSKNKTLTTKYQGSETDKKTTTIEIVPLKTPTHKPLVIKKDCSDLKLENNYYKTIMHGCCGGDDALAIYDYQNNLIIEGDVKILRAEIPNTPHTFFTSYKSNNTETDTSFLGTVFCCFNSHDRYQIKINKSRALPTSCEYRAPEIFLNSSSSKDKFVMENNEYHLWSLSEIKSKEQINDISIKLVFECNTSSKFDTITISIINGKPFGKNDRIQTYSYK